MTDARDDPQANPHAGGVDFRWVMETTFVATIVVGAPLVAVLSVVVELESWPARAAFAARVGAAVWIVVALAVYAFARRHVEAV